MKTDHITDLLANTRYRDLSESDLAGLHRHIAGCDSCRRAFDAARVADSLVVKRAEAMLEPSPFFETRLMAQIRQRQAANEVSPLARAWRAAYGMVASMAAVVILLFALTYYTGGPAPEKPSVAYDADSAEGVLFAHDMIDDEEIIDAQVINAFYESYGDGMTPAKENRQ